MELRINIGFDQIIGLISTLPYNDKLFLKNKLVNELEIVPKESSIALRQLLLNGPIMTKEGYNNYKDLKKQFNKWSKKLSV
jgi:hypothetical protein